MTNRINRYLNLNDMDAYLKEFNELIDKCEWKRIRKNRVWGMHITGQNGNSIFLPAADSRRGRHIPYPGEEGRYWSASPGDRKTNDYAHSLVFRKNNICSVYWNSSRNEGYTIRPIHNPSF